MIDGDDIFFKKVIYEDNNNNILNLVRQSGKS